MVFVSRMIRSVSFTYLRAFAFKVDLLFDCRFVCHRNLIFSPLTLTVRCFPPKDSVESEFEAFGIRRILLKYSNGVFKYTHKVQLIFLGFDFKRLAHHMPKTRDKPGL